MKIDESSPIGVWLADLADGGGRNGQLTGQQRHFLRVIDGQARPLMEEKVWLIHYRELRMRAPAQSAPHDTAPLSSATPAKSRNALNSSGNPTPSNKRPEDGLAALAGASAVARAKTTRPNQATDQRGRESISQQRVSSSGGTTTEQSGQRDWSQEPEEVQLAYVVLVIASWMKATGWRPSGLSGFIGSIADQSRTSARAVGDSLHRVDMGRAEIGRQVAAGTKTTGDTVADLAAGAASGLRRVRKWTDSVNASMAPDPSIPARRSGANEPPQATTFQTIGDKAKRTGLAITKAVAIVGEVAAIGVAGTARTLSRNSGTVGAVVEGTVGGVAGALGGAADSYGIQEGEIAALRTEIASTRSQAIAIRRTLSDAMAKGNPYVRRLWLEQLTVGGLAASDILAGQPVPQDVLDAYTAAYPVESEQIDFASKVASLASGDELQGLLNAVKGKLFELKYVEELNAAIGPSGLHAALAESATQPGWDLVIANADGRAIEFLSLKATEHVHYVREALDRYPDIDVVTTSEVYAALATTPYGDRIIDGGLSNSHLAESVESAAEGSTTGMDDVLPLAALLPAAYVHLVASKGSVEARAAGFSEHVGRAKTATVAGTAAMVIAPYWPVALLAAAGMSMLGRVGNNRREELLRLRAIRDDLRSATSTLLDYQKIIGHIAASRSI